MSNIVLTISNILCDEKKMISVAIEFSLDLISTILIFFAAIIPAYLSVMLKGEIRKLTIGLTGFVVIHGIYHIASMQGLETMAEGVLEPASIAVLIAFGLAYLQVSHKKNRRQLESE